MFSFYSRLTANYLVYRENKFIFFLLFSPDRKWITTSEMQKMREREKINKNKIRKRRIAHASENCIFVRFNSDFACRYCKMEGKKSKWERDGGKMNPSEVQNARHKIARKTTVLREVNKKKKKSVPIGFGLRPAQCKKSCDALIVPCPAVSHK
jgi:hypothetical protein